MKRRVCLLGILACLMISTLCVRADVIYEPQDSFYRTHAGECTYVNRCFIVNGPDGQAIVYKNPESPKVIGTLENGAEITISYTYQDSDGILWGICDTDQKRTGWMPMDYLQVIYDYISFQEEYGEKFVEQSGCLGEEYKGKDVCFWPYPGSEECFIMSMDWEDMPEYRFVYTDEKGHSWGFVGYYFGIRNSWVCIDQPTAVYEELYPQGGPGIGVQSEDGNPEWQGGRIAPHFNKRTILITAALVAAVVAVTAILLVKLKKKG